MPNPGCLTPSSFGDLMTNGRGSNEMGKTAKAVVDLLVMDLLGVERNEREGTPKTCQWGIDHEWEAIELYSERTFREVLHPVEFRISQSHSYVGGTMDGLVGKCGGIEVKCPANSNGHLENLREAKQFKTTYRYQLQGYFWIYELEWIDCVSYDPRYPEPERIAIYREYPDEAVIRELKERCELAYAMVLDEVERLRGERCG